MACLLYTSSNLSTQVVNKEFDDFIQQLSILDKIKNDDEKRCV